MTRWLILAALAASHGVSASAGSEGSTGPVPDFEVTVAKSSASSWALDTRPPPKHHFNLKAPFSAEAVTGSSTFRFTVDSSEERRIRFSSAGGALAEGGAVRVSAFLCDDAKTYCIKKTRELPLRRNSEGQRARPIESSGKGGPLPMSAPPRKSSTLLGPDSFGFHVDDPETAIAEAVTRHVPLLIDFYGIWCPPCNLYVEQVFPSPEFRKLRKKFVLLKLDADREVSFPLKSRYRVGGYPTWVVADPQTLAELGRVVGFLPAREFSARVLGFVQDGVQNAEGRLARKRKAFLEELKENIRGELEKKDFIQAEKFLAEGFSISPSDRDLALFRWEVRSASAEGFQATKGDEEAFSGFLSGKESLSSGLALRAAYWILDEPDHRPKAWVERSSDLLDVLEQRVDAATGFVPGAECSLADLKALRMERAKALKLDAEAALHRSAALEAWAQMARKTPDSRGIHLEWAGLLVEAGRYDEAQAIFDRFLKKYPAEFTFYHAAARLFMQKKDWNRARELSEKAVQYAYGDNLIRSTDRLVQILKAQGATAEAKGRGEKLLASLRLDPSLQVRTQRYVQALRKTLESISEEKH